MTQEELPAIIKSVHDNAVKHGWHNETKPQDHWLMMIITEISEMVEADRKGRHADVDSFNLEVANFDAIFEGYNRESSFKFYFEKYIKDTVEDEMANVCIRIFDMVGEMYSVDAFITSLAMHKEFLKSDEEIKKTLGSMTFTEAALSLVRQLVYTFGETLNNLAITYQALMSFARAYSIDLDWHIKQKMKYNELRPYHHGGKKY